MILGSYFKEIHIHFCSSAARQCGSTPMATATTDGFRDDVRDLQSEVKHGTFVKPASPDSPRLASDFAARVPAAGLGPAPGETWKAMNLVASESAEKLAPRYTQS